MSWFVWISCFHCAKKKKRNWRKKSYWSICSKHYNHAVKRFFKTNMHIIIDCISCIVVANEQLAARLCIPHPYYSVCVCDSGIIGNANNIIHDKFSINKGSDCKSCEEFENGMNISKPACRRQVFL